MTDRRFGVSTHLFHEERLTREHLVHIAAHDFEAVELFATRSHFDYRDAAAVAQLGEWLADTRLELHAIHAPVCEAISGGVWKGAFSNAAAAEDRRQAAVREAQAALAMAERLPFRYLVTHVGVPDPYARGGDNAPEAARRSVEELHALAEARGVKLALEVMPNALSSATALVTLIEDRLDGLDVGICLDYGHAHLMGGVDDAVEAVSGHLWTTHIHDNRATRDDHLVPYAGTINWDAAMMETQKIGYEGTLVFEVGADGDPVETLQRMVRARERLERAFVTF